MAFGSRYSFLAIFFFAAIVLSIIFIVCALLVFLFSWDVILDFYSAQIYWFLYDSAGQGMIVSILGIFFLVIGGFTAFFMFRSLFKKTGSAELFFITIFFFSLLFEALRLGIYLAEMGGLGEYLNLPGTRIVFAGRLFGLLCLFTASLYAGNFSYQKFEILIGIAILISGFLAFSISFDQTVFLSNGLLKLGDESGLFIIFTALKLLILVNYFVSNSKRQIFYSLLGVTLCIGGRELLFFALDPLLLGAGIIAGCIGFIILFRNLENFYSWI